MLITNSEYRAKIVTLLHESKKASNKWRNHYYKEADYDWSYQEYIDAIEDRLNDYGLEVSEKNILTVAKYVYVMAVHNFAGNIDIGIADVVDDMAEQQSVIQ